MRSDLFHIIKEQTDYTPCMVITLAAAGDMRTNARNNILKNLGIKRDRLRILKQIHSQRIFETRLNDQYRLLDENENNIICKDLLTEKQKDGRYEGDGLLSTDKNDVLGIFVADCLPIFLTHVDSGMFGILHSGWKGTGIVTKGIRLLENRWGIAPAEIEAVLGPCIDTCCYQVDNTRADFFKKNWGQECVTERSNKYYISLKIANQILLEKIGIKYIEEMNACTACDERFTSFRRQGPDQYALMLALIGYFQ